MKLEELNSILNKLEIPVAYSHFKEAQEAPYVCYVVDDDNNIGADNKVYKKIDNINIELYTEKKDVELEGKLEKILDDNNIFYENIEYYIDSEELFKKTYEIGVILDVDY